MKLFKPQVQLVRVRRMNKKDKFFLHAVTFTDQANYVAAGHEIAEELDEEGMLMIVLYLKEANNNLHFSYLTPVVHTFKIGPLPFDDDESGLLRICAVIQDQRDAQTAGEGVVSSGDADEDSRPG